MVYHMIPKDVIALYIPQWVTALKPGGRILIVDHNPMGTHSGPRRPMSYIFGVGTMVVVPQDTEVNEITSGGFSLLEGPFEHPFFHGGYGAVYQAIPQASTS